MEQTGPAAGPVGARLATTRAFSDAHPHSARGMGNDLPWLLAICLATYVRKLGRCAAWCVVELHPTWSMGCTASHRDDVPAADPLQFHGEVTALLLGPLTHSSMSTAVPAGCPLHLSPLCALTRTFLRFGAQERSMMVAGPKYCLPDYRCWLMLGYIRRHESYRR